MQYLDMSKTYLEIPRRWRIGKTEESRQEKCLKLPLPPFKLEEYLNFFKKT